MRVIIWKSSFLLAQAGDNKTASPGFARRWQTETAAFKAVEHRIEYVREVDGVADLRYNDRIFRRVKRRLRERISNISYHKYIFSEIILHNPNCYNTFVYDRILGIVRKDWLFLWILPEWKYVW